MGRHLWGTEGPCPGESTSAGPGSSPILLIAPSCMQPGRLQSQRQALARPSMGRRGSCLPAPDRHVAAALGSEGIPSPCWLPSCQGQALGSVPSCPAMSGGLRTLPSVGRPGLCALTGLPELGILLPLTSSWSRGSGRWRSEASTALSLHDARLGDCRGEPHCCVQRTPGTWTVPPPATHTGSTHFSHQQIRMQAHLPTLGGEPIRINLFSHWPTRWPIMCKGRGARCHHLVAAQGPAPATSGDPGSEIPKAACVCRQVTGVSVTNGQDQLVVFHTCSHNDLVVCFHKMQPAGDNRVGELVGVLADHCKA